MTDVTSRVSAASGLPVFFGTLVIQLLNSNYKLISYILPILPILHIP